MEKIKLPNSNPEFIKKLIPQREPIIMVDSILEFEENKIVGGLTISSELIFTKNNQFLEPGILEHMAQTVALYTGYQFFVKDKEAPTGYIGSMKGIEIFDLPKTGNKLVTTATILHEIMDVTLVYIETKINDKVVAKGEMKTVLA